MGEEKRDGHQTANLANYAILKGHARENQNHPTDAERHLWYYLQSDAMGVRFRRQHIIGNYIADFVCLPLKLIIELDGRYHFYPDQQSLDEIRTTNLTQRGFKVIRFTNEEVMYKTEEVLIAIEKYIKETN